MRIKDKAVLIVKQTLKRKKTVLVFLLSAVLYSTVSHSSPWVEAQDPMLRSNIQLLSDSGLLTSATNSYPFRWVQISDELLAINRTELTLEQALAYRYVKHSYDTARLTDYGNQFTTFISSDNKTSSGFGDTTRGQWNISALKEITDKQFSMRISAGYHKNQQGEDEYNFNDSYFALGSSNWQLSISNVERWWGHGWANSLSFSQQDEPMETLGVAYLGDGNLLPANLWIESFIGLVDSSNKQNNFNDDYVWSSRVAGKISIIEFGAGYQLLNQSRQYQTTVDAKVALPEIVNIYSSFYGSLSFDNHTYIGRTLIGWDAQTLLSNQLIRFYIEQVSNDEKPLNNGVQHSGFIHQEENVTLGAHLLLSNDHQLSIQMQEFTDVVDSKVEAKQQITYALPALSGMATLGLSNEIESGKNDLVGWLSWDYRF